MNSKAFISMLTSTTFQCKIEIQLNFSVLEKHPRAYTVYSGVCVQCCVSISS